MPDETKTEATKTDEATSPAAKEAKGNVKASPVTPPAANEPPPAPKPVLPGAPAPKASDTFEMTTNSLAFTKGQIVTREELGAFAGDWLKRGIIKRV